MYGFTIASSAGMKRILSAVIVSAALLGFADAARAQVSVGIQIGAPPAPRAYHVPPRPAPAYEWVEGYWYVQGGHYHWHNGYWTRPPYPGAYWVAPYYVQGHYYPGQWEGGRGVVSHQHRWDQTARRDYGREPERTEHARR
jgi:hypothetical protein